MRSSSRRRLAEPPSVAVATDRATVLAPKGRWPPDRGRRERDWPLHSGHWPVVWLWRSGERAAPSHARGPPHRDERLGAGRRFSPDGRQVAFAWNGEPPDGGARPWWQGNWDIYVKLVGSADMRRLTTGPGIDLAPAWSPDGREIAYVRDRHIRRGIRARRVRPPNHRLPGHAARRSGRPTAGTWWLEAAGTAGGVCPPDTASTSSRSQGGEPRALTRPRPRAASSVAGVLTGRPSPRICLVWRRAAAGDVICRCSTWTPPTPRPALRGR